MRAFSMNGRISANSPKLAKHRSLLIRARVITDFGKSTPGVCTASAQTRIRKTYRYNLLCFQNLTVKMMPVGAAALIEQGPKELSITLINGYYFVGLRINYCGVYKHSIS